MVYYPTLVGELAKREIKKVTLARSIGVCDKALKNKLSGKTPFTWPEVRKIRSEFFSDIPVDTLFATADELQSST